MKEQNGADVNIMHGADWHRAIMKVQANAAKRP